MFFFDTGSWIYFKIPVEWSSCCFDATNALKTLMSVHTSKETERLERQQITVSNKIFRRRVSNFGQNDKRESLNTLFAQVSRVRRVSRDACIFFPQITRSLVFDRQNENLNSIPKFASATDQLFRIAIHNSGIMSFSFLCGTQRILWQKVRTKAWTTAISLSPLREYCYHLVLNSNSRVKMTRWRGKTIP